MNKTSLKVLLFSLVVVLIANFVGFNTSFKRRRDIQRINDLGDIARGLILYKSEFGYYPLSNDSGNIVGCIGEKTDLLRDKMGKPIPSKFKKPTYVNLAVCNWGDPLLDPGDTNYPKYIDRIPSDPLSNKNVNYHYVSDGKRFQLYGYLELNKEHKDYDKKIVELNIKCGNKICNFGRSEGITLTEKLK